MSSEEFEEELPGTSSDPLSVTMETVSTAKPTILTRKKPIVPKLGRIPQRDKELLNKSKLDPSLHTKKSISPNSKNKTLKHKGKRLNNIDGNNVTKIKKKALEDVNVTVVESSESDSEVFSQIDTTSLDTKFTITPDLIESLDGFCAVADIVTVTTSNEAEEKESDADEDVEIDIEDDDDESSFNPFFPERSVSPNSVYEKLLLDANIKPDKTEHVSKTYFASARADHDNGEVNKMLEISKTIVMDSPPAEVEFESSKTFDIKEQLVVDETGIIDQNIEYEVIRQMAEDAAKMEEKACMKGPEGGEKVLGKKC